MLGTISPDQFTEKKNPPDHALFPIAILVRINFSLIFINLFT